MILSNKAVLVLAQNAIPMMTAAKTEMAKKYAKYQWLHRMTDVVCILTIKNGASLNMKNVTCEHGLVVLKQDKW
jgi:hypothetical protein